MPEKTTFPLVLICILVVSGCCCTYYADSDTNANSARPSSPNRMSAATAAVQANGIERLDRALSRIDGNACEAEVLENTQNEAAHIEEAMSNHYDVVHNPSIYSDAQRSDAQKELGKIASIAANARLYIADTRKNMGVKK